MYTWGGDANLDGTLNGDDYFQIDDHVNQSGAFGYQNGDFNYDGLINGDDYFIIDNNISIGQSAAPFATIDAGPSVMAVPEPAMLGASALLLLGARRRYRSAAR
jgi:hypothetical protein